MRGRIVGWMGRRYPFYSGCGKLAQLAVMRHLAGDGEAWTRLRNGCPICVPLMDYDGRTIYFFGDLDSKVTWLCEALLRPGDTAVDIGANLGAVTLAMGKRVGVRGQVVAFEPIPRTASFLQRSIAANSSLPITLIPSAVGDSDGYVTMHISLDHSGRSSVVRGGDDAQKVLVPAVEASGALTSLGPIRLVKIDVEGYEPFVLRGMRRVLRENPPAFILFECQADPTQTMRHESVRLLQEHGYQIMWITRSMRRPQLRHVSLGIGRRSVDLLAVHRAASDDSAVRPLCC